MGRVRKGGVGAIAPAVMEVVEPRRLLAAFVLRPQGVLEITGSDAANDIQATLASGQLTINVDGVSQSFPRSKARQVVIKALGGDDLIRIEDNVDYKVDGGSGNDTFVSGTGSDTFLGGDGNDTADYSSRTRRVFLSLDGKANDGEKCEHDKLGDDVEVLIGGQGNDCIAGNDLANTLVGGGGNDTLVAGLGNDALDGGEGDDTLDYTSRSQAMTVLFGHGGTVKIGAEIDALAADTSVTILGGSGADTFTINTSAMTNVLADAGPGDDTLAAAGMTETGHITIRGGSGNDTLATGTELGADNFFPFGGAGDDICFAKHLVNFDGGSGSDMFSAAKSFNIDFIDLRTMPTTENAALSPDAGGTIIGNNLDNHFVGTQFGDTFLGGAGNDTVDYSARTGDLTISLDGVADDGAAGEGDFVGDDIENITGGSGNDTLVGNDQRNTLDGGAGNDLIIGNGGRDNLIGGIGNDTFFNADATRDTINGGDGDDTAQTDFKDLIADVEHQV